LSGWRRTAQPGGGDLAAAIALYEWNAQVSAALGETLGHLEVLLRNAIHDELTAWSVRRFADPRWYLNPGGFLFAEERADVAKARARAVRDGRHETPGRIVAELNLGFWRFLLSRRYDRGLWHPCLHRTFPRQRRKAVYDAVRTLHDARNRMAHHEPMFNRPVSDLRRTAIQVADWICPVTRSWIETRCRVPELLGCRPGQP
jgi:hypothetical protein